MNSIGRKTFLNKLSLGAIGSLVLAFIPTNMFGKKKHKLPSNLKVKLHPNSVKRNK